MNNQNNGKGGSPPPIAPESERPANRNKAGYTDQPAEDIDLLQAIVKPADRMGNTVSQGITVDWLADLVIPNPGITVIGAKTEGGKTTAMINLARSIIAKDKKVLFITLEQRAPEIYTMLCMSKTRSGLASDIDMNADPEALKTLFTYTPNAGRGRPPGYVIPFIDYYSNRKEQHQFIQEADNFYKGIMDKRLFILDGILHREKLSNGYHPLHRLIDTIDPDFIIVDYLQILPPVAEGRFTGYERMADITRELVKIGNKRSVITGAQFNRMKGATDKSTAEEFDPMLELFREAADIEHAATLAIGIGYYTNFQTQDKRYYYKILKSRHGGGSGKKYLPSLGQYPWIYASPTPYEIQWDTGIPDMEASKAAAEAEKKKAKADKNGNGKNGKTVSIGEIQ